jgi:type I site-specific restriction endonuclease
MWAGGPKAAMNEADTCRKYVLPNLYKSSWTDDQINEQRTFTDGRIVIAGKRPLRRPQKRADYILRYRRDFPSLWWKPRPRTRTLVTAYNRSRNMR